MTSCEEQPVLLPPSKRQKLDLEEVIRPQPKPAWNQGQLQPTTVQLGPASEIKSEFPLRSLEDFYKTCPTYRLPVEIGCFSLDEKGKQQLDKSQLRYFIHSLPHTSRLNFDLKLGYDKYIRNDRNVPSDKLNPILRWVAVNGECFRPKVFSPKSPEKVESGYEGETNGSTADPGRRVSVEEGVTPTLNSKDRYLYWFRPVHAKKLT